MFAHLRAAAGTLLFAGLVAAQQVHFHHLHFNSVDPAAAIEFYTTHFNGEKAKFDGQDAVWTGKSWLLFNKVSRPPPHAIIASIYHLGWGERDIKAAYQHQLDIGTKFETPLGDLADLLGRGTPGRGYYAYVDGPDHALIEMNGSNTDHFQHIHLLSDDPVSAAAWYEKEFEIPHRGPPPSREPAFNKHGLQVGPMVFLNIDSVLFAWFPTATAQGLYPDAWKGRTKLATNEGRVIDHFAFSVDSLDQTLARMKKDGVKILSKHGRSAFILGPDNARIELVEGQAVKP